MEDTQIIDCTQLNFDVSREENEDQELIGWLEILGFKHEIWEGTAKIGRDPSSCNILLQNQKTISKEHAIIEAESAGTFLMDLGSRNKTKIGKKSIKPNVRYALQGGECLQFGDLKATFILNIKVDDSDPDSDSMLSSNIICNTPDHRGPNESSDASMISPTPQVSTKVSLCKVEVKELSKSNFIPETPAFVGVVSAHQNQSKIVGESPVSQSTPFPSNRHRPSHSALQNFTSPTFLSPIIDSSLSKQHEIESNNSQLNSKKAVSFNLECSKEESHKDVNYNSDESTDIEDFFKDSEEEDGGPISTKKKSSSANSKLEEDIFCMPTQLFPSVSSKQYEVDTSINEINTQEVVAAFKYQEKLRGSADDTQEILDAFEKPTQDIISSPNNSLAETQVFRDPDNIVEGKFIKPSSARSRPNKKVTESHQENIFDAATQVFHETLVSMPSTVEKSCKESDIEDIFDAPTQPFNKQIEECEKTKSDHDNDYDLSDAPTQIFEPPIYATDVSTKVIVSPSKNLGLLSEVSTQIKETQASTYDDHSSKVIPDTKSNKNQYNCIGTKVKDYKAVKLMQHNFHALSKPVISNSDVESDSSDSNLSENLLPDLDDTQIFYPPTHPSLLPSKVIEDSDIVSKSVNNEDQDCSLPPTQKFSPIIDKDLPISKRSPSIIKEMNHSCSPNRAIQDDSSLPPTQVFNHSHLSNRGNDNDPDCSLPPTQIFYPPVKDVPTSRRSFSLIKEINHSCSPNRVVEDPDSIFPPTQIIGNAQLQNSFIKDTDCSLQPTQVFCDAHLPNQPIEDEDCSLPPTQVFSNPNFNKINIDDLDDTQVFSRSHCLSKNKYADRKNIKLNTIQDKSASSFSCTNNERQKLKTIVHIETESDNLKTKVDCPKECLGISEDTVIQTDDLTGYNSDESTDIEDELCLPISKHKVVENAVEYVSTDVVLEPKNSKSLLDKEIDCDNLQSIDECPKKDGIEEGNEILRNISKLQKNDLTGYNSDESTDIEDELGLCLSLPSRKNIAVKDDGASVVLVSENTKMILDIDTVYHDKLENKAESFKDLPDCSSDKSTDLKNNLCLSMKEKETTKKIVEDDGSNNSNSSSHSLFKNTIESRKTGSLLDIETDSKATLNEGIKVSIEKSKEMHKIEAKQTSESMDLLKKDLPGYNSDNSVDIDELFYKAIQNLLPGSEARNNLAVIKEVSEKSDPPPNFPVSFGNRLTCESQSSDSSKDSIDTSKTSFSKAMSLQHVISMSEDSQSPLKQNNANQMNTPVNYACEDIESSYSEACDKSEDNVLEVSQELFDLNLHYDDSSALNSSPSIKSLEKSITSTPLSKENMNNGTINSNNFNNNADISSNSPFNVSKNTSCNKSNLNKNCTKPYEVLNHGKPNSPIDDLHLLQNKNPAETEKSTGTNGFAIATAKSCRRKIIGEDLEESMIDTVNKHVDLTYDKSSKIVNMANTLSHVKSINKKGNRINVKDKKNLMTTTKDSSKSITHTQSAEGNVLQKLDKLSNDQKRKTKSSKLPEGNRLVCKSNILCDVNKSGDGVSEICELSEVKILKTDNMTRTRHGRRSHAPAWFSPSRSDNSLRNIDQNDLNTKKTRTAAKRLTQLINVEHKRKSTTNSKIFVKNIGLSKMAEISSKDNLNIENEHQKIPLSLRDKQSRPTSSKDELINEESQNNSIVKVGNISLIVKLTKSAKVHTQTDVQSNIVKENSPKGPMTKLSLDSFKGKADTIIPQALLHGNKKPSNNTSPVQISSSQEIKDIEPCGSLNNKKVDTNKLKSPPKSTRSDFESSGSLKIKVVEANNIKSLQVSTTTTRSSLDKQVLKVNLSPKEIKSTESSGSSKVNVEDADKIKNPQKSTTRTALHKNVLDENLSTNEISCNESSVSLKINVVEADIIKSSLKSATRSSLRKNVLDENLSTNEISCNESSGLLKINVVEADESKSAQKSSTRNSLNKKILDENLSTNELRCNESSSFIKNNVVEGYKSKRTQKSSTRNSSHTKVLDENLSNNEIRCNESSSFLKNNVLEADKSLSTSTQKSSTRSSLHKKVLNENISIKKLKCIESSGSEKVNVVEADKIKSPPKSTTRSSLQKHVLSKNVSSKDIDLNAHVNLPSQISSGNTNVIESLDSQTFNSRPKRASKRGKKFENSVTGSSANMNDRENPSKKLRNDAIKLSVISKEQLNEDADLPNKSNSTNGSINNETLNLSMKTTQTSNGKEVFSSKIEPIDVKVPQNSDSICSVGRPRRTCKLGQNFEGFVTEEYLCKRKTKDKFLGLDNVEPPFKRSKKDKDITVSDTEIHHLQFSNSVVSEISCTGGITKVEIREMTENVKTTSLRNTRNASKRKNCISNKTNLNPSVPNNSSLVVHNNDKLHNSSKTSVTDFEEMEPSIIVGFQSAETKSSADGVKAVKRTLRNDSHVDPSDDSLKAESIAHIDPFNMPNEPKSSDVNSNAVRPKRLSKKSVSIPNANNNVKGVYRSLRKTLRSSDENSKTTGSLLLPVHKEMENSIPILSNSENNLKHKTFHQRKSKAIPTLDTGISLDNLHSLSPDMLSPTYPKKDAEPSVISRSKSTRSTRSKRSCSPPFSNETILWSPSQRQAMASKKPRVLFTSYKDDKDEKIVKDMGGHLVENVDECTVLVTNAVRRTVKFLASIGKGVPIVSSEWLIACKQAGNFVDPWQYLIMDKISEKKFGFSLKKALSVARKKKLFSGYSFHVTDSVMPPPDQMREIIESAGGEYLEISPKMFAEKVLIISCEEDRQTWSSFKKVGFPLLHAEFILTGLLKQQIRIKETKLT